MPEYLTPGVYVEEVSFRPSSIQAASTSVAGMVGPTRFGPIRGRPLLLTSYSDYESAFGDALNLTFSGASVPNYTAYAARAFFDNGGQQLYLSRIVNDVLGEGDPSQRPSTAALAIPASGTTLLTFGARFSGTGGNVDLVLTPRRSAKMLVASAATAGTAATVLVTVSGVVATDLVQPNAAIPAGAFPLAQLTALATYAAADTSPERWVLTPSDLVFYTDQSGVSQAVAGSGFAKAITTAAVTAHGGQAQVLALAPAAGLGATPLYSIPVGPITRQIVGLSATSNATTLYATVSGPNAALPKALNPDLANDTTVPLAALTMGKRPGDGNIYHDSYDISVLSSGVPVFSFADVDLEQDAANNLAVALAQSPASGSAQTSQPVYAAYTGTVGVSALWGALQAAFDTASLRPTNPAVAPSYVLHLTGGADGASPQTADYAGLVDEVNGSFGLAALEGVDEVSIVLCPAAAADSSIHQAVAVEIQKHCAKMLYRVGIIESGPGQAVADVQQFRSQFSDTRLALYYPWITATSLAPGGGQILLPPSGFIAGVCANTDITRGVHKAPANEVVLGALSLEVFINSRQQAVLNPIGINCIRFFPDRGYRVWGDRTLADDPQWKYLNVRRYFLFLEHSISNSTNWVVFEPNGQRLWDNVVATVEDFLYNEWASGHLLGARPEQAYFVRCDLTTMTQNDLDNGRLVCLIGVAPLEPAEFVIFRIGQMTASA
jgi:uncharacterized protein